MATIGILGVGHIGKLFVDRLAGTERRVFVFDIDEEQTAYATERGATAVETPRELAERTEVVLVALPGSAEVEATVGGDDGVIAGLDGGELIIDVTTTHPDTSVACEERCEEAGVDFVEAPITGGAPREGYHVMVGGTRERYERAADTLDLICDAHTRVGPIPNGTVLKLGLQLRYAGHRAVDAEVVEFVRDNGVDPRLFNDFLGFDVWERYFTGDFGQDVEGLGGFAIWDKDVGYAREFAHDRNTALPLGGVVHEAYKAATRRTDDGEGHAAALIEYWLALNDAQERYE